MNESDGKKPPRSRLQSEPKLTVKEAAGRIGIGVTSLRRLINEGQLPVLRLGTKILLLERDVEQYLQGHYGHIVVAECPHPRPGLPEWVRNSDVLKME